MPEEIEQNETQQTISDPEQAHVAEQPPRQNPVELPERPGCNLPAREPKLQEKVYLLNVCRGLITYGAPYHRLEEYMQMTARALELRIQSFSVPGCMIISFDASVWCSKEVHIIRCVQALNLSKLYEVHAIYKDVVHQKLTSEQAVVRLDGITNRSDKFSRRTQVLAYGLASAFIGPVSYGARPIDLPIIFLLGSLVGFMELVLAPKSDIYSHIFLVSSSIVTAFISRALGSIRLDPSNSFCFAAISQASLVLILPGFIITNSALELQSKNIVSGSVRMVYGIIYTLFLAFGITIGTTIYGAIDSDATSATTCATTWPFWWQLIFVLPFTVCYIIVHQGKWTKTPAMLILTLVGWLVNHFSAIRFTASPQIAQALGALTVGVLANVYSRLGHDLAAALLYPAVFIQVPGSFAASGGFISGIKSADQLTGNKNGAAMGNGTRLDASMHRSSVILNAGYSMIEIAIGISVGLSVSAFIAYPFWLRKGRSGLFSF